MYPEHGAESHGTFSNRRPYHPYDPLPRLGSRGRVCVCSCGGADSAGNAPIGIAAPHSAAPPRSHRPSAGPIVLTSPSSLQLTASDNGRTVFAPVNSVIVIDLVEKTPDYAWQVPQSTTSVTSTLSGQRSSGGGAQARFAIRRTGETSLTTTNDCQGKGCEGSSEVWKVNLIVRA